MSISDRKVQQQTECIGIVLKALDRSVVCFCSISKFKFWTRFDVLYGTLALTHIYQVNFIRMSINSALHVQLPIFLNKTVRIYHTCQFKRKSKISDYFLLQKTIHPQKKKEKKET